MKGISLAGTVFRLCPPLFANAQDAISGEAALTSPGRYHICGAFRIVYTATSLKGALDEFATEEYLPLTVFALDVELSRVLDLTDEAVRAALGVTIEQLLIPDWTAAQRIGQQAFEAGFEAILAPTRWGAPNLNVLVDNLLPGAVFRVRDAEKLPPQGA